MTARKRKLLTIYDIAEAKFDDSGPPNQLLNGDAGFLCAVSGAQIIAQVAYLSYQKW